MTSGSNGTENTGSPCESIRTGTIGAHTPSGTRSLRGKSLPHPESLGSTGPVDEELKEELKEDEDILPPVKEGPGIVSRGVVVTGVVGVVGRAPPAALDAVVE